MIEVGIVTISIKEYDQLRYIDRQYPLMCEMVDKTSYEYFSIGKGWTCDEDGFKMNPGYSNFQQITEGEVLGQDINGDVKAPHSGYIMMPLYQKQGDEGFFITQDPQNN